jgi:hypothetical protein
VNREAELEWPSRVACSDLLDHEIILLNHAFGADVIFSIKSMSNKAKEQSNSIIFQGEGSQRNRYRHSGEHQNADENRSSGDSKSYQPRHTTQKPLNGTS